MKFEGPWFSLEPSFSLVSRLFRGESVSGEGVGVPFRLGVNVCKWVRHWNVSSVSCIVVVTFAVTVAS